MPRKKLALIQFSRALVPLMVVTFHAAASVMYYFDFDFLGLSVYPLSGGVNYFFTLTGFMVFYIYYKKLAHREELRPYLLQRFIRIYPLYWILSFLWLMVIILLPAHFGVGHETEAATLWYSLLLLPSSQALDPILLVAWSLIHTVLFYAVFALLFLKQQRLIKGFFVIWMAGSLLYALGFIPGEQELVYFAFSQYNLMFAAGIASAWLVLRAPFPAGVGWLLTAAGLAGFPLTWANYHYEWLPLAFDLTTGAASVLLLLGLGSIDLRKDIYLPQALDYLGRAAFSIYLSHLVLLDIFSELFAALSLFDLLGGWVTTLLFILLSSAGGCLVYSYMERPLTSYLKKRLITKPAPLTNRSVQQPRTSAK
ncbi:acyltransferase [Sinobaca sp. H24]|uniref:acyltransferase family protein n=1 Tax=Sinobaca sp. H24 TaxID=2923376 RepID=UPI002079538E|nr:acyltransferase [Sinobaca sp. H24]